MSLNATLVDRIEEKMIVQIQMIIVDLAKLAQLKVRGSIQSDYSASSRENECVQSIPTSQLITKIITIHPL